MILMFCRSYYDYSSPAYSDPKICFKLSFFEFEYFIQPDSVVEFTQFESGSPAGNLANLKAVQNSELELTILTKPNFKTDMV